MRTIKYLHVFKLIAAAVMLNSFFISCKREKGTVGEMPPPPPVPTVFLKEIVIPGLPSPYYHFEYDGTGKTSVGAFASGLMHCNILYDNTGRITEMRNVGVANRDTLKYYYDNTGKAIAIHYIDIAGRVYVKVSLTYEGRKLVQLERKRILAGVGDFVTNKIMTFSYYADGNLKEITDHRPAVDGQPETTLNTRFEEYDDKINVDDFGILHNDFFDDFWLLPGITLQKNNPRKEIVTG